MSTAFKLVVLLCGAALLVVVVPGPADAMPRNARQTAEGYWVGGVPSAFDMDDLANAGIRVLLSGVILEQDARNAARRQGLERVNVWFGNNFPEPSEILEPLAAYQPAEIYVHCDHGGDRAGALLAFLLVVRQGWRPDHALLAVANPSPRDVDGLVAVLEEAGFEITEEERSELTGIYSGASNGGTGGLKIRGPDYRNLVRTMLEACASLGIEVTDPLLPLALEGASDAARFSPPPELEPGDAAASGVVEPAAP